MPSRHNSVRRWPERVLGWWESSDMRLARQLPAISRLAGLINGPGAQADALFLPESPEGLAIVAPALAKAGFSPSRVKPIGTAVWNDPRLFALPALQGRLVRSGRFEGIQRFLTALSGAVRLCTSACGDAGLRRCLAHGSAVAAIWISALRRRDADDAGRLLGDRRHLPLPAGGGKR